MLMSYRDMKEKCERLEPGYCALYTWQNPMSERVLIWRCTDKNKDFENELVKVSCISSGKYLELFTTCVSFS